MFISWGGKSRGGKEGVHGVEKRLDSTSLFSITFSINIIACSAVSYHILLYSGDSHLLQVIGKRGIFHLC